MNKLRTILLLILTLAPAQTVLAQKGKIPVFVSILPQAYFVEQIGGDRVSVSVMIGPGHSPATYDPSPRQIASLSQTQLYFRIGIPFENVWMHRIEQINPAMKIIDTRDKIALRTMESHSHDEAEEHGHNNQEDSGHEIIKDPHIWLDPTLVKIQAQTICKALQEIDPIHKEDYTKRLSAFLIDLDTLDRDIRESLKSLHSRNFLVFHPSWGYFADAYKLKQIPIEAEGKEPSAKQLAQLIDHAKEEQINAIFVQPQFDKRIASTIAKTIGCKVVILDPLAKDYLSNMRNIATQIQKAMQ